MKHARSLPSRRAVLALLGAGAGLAATGCSGRAIDLDDHRAAAEVDREPEQLRRMVGRLTFGATAELLDEVDRDGFDAWLDRQLDPASIPDHDLDAALAGLSTWSRSFDERRSLAESDEGRRQLRSELLAGTLARAVHSRRQLNEVLVHTWHDHFNTDASMPGVAFSKADESTGFRDLATGRFADLLAFAAASPTMLLYLDNARSRAPSPNENYGRELLELHTVGIDGGYDEDDVVDTARVFTGWSLDRQTGAFTFRPAWHDSGPKSVLGWETPGRRGGTGVEEGRSLLEYLAGLPATARRVSWRLARRLVADDLPPETIEAGAAAYLETDGSIAAVVRALVGTDAFRSGEHPKVSRPFEAVALMLRRSGATVPLDTSQQRSARAVQAIGARLGTMGQPLFRFPAPTGLPDVAAAWVSTNGTLARWATAADVGADRFGVLEVDHRSLARDAATVVDAATSVARSLWLEAPAPDELALLVDATGRRADDTVDDETIAGLCGLALAAEAYTR